MSDILFSFGIITDTHIRPPQGDNSSPFPVNDKANQRARYAAKLLAKQNPAFTVHMGDVVHTLPAMPLYDDACVEAHSILEPLQPNLHFMPGNHDIGDKPMPASPAASVTESAAERYQKHFGEPWHCFEFEDSLFVIINSSLLNSGSDAESEQAKWLEATLTEKSGKRIFLFSHYPPFIHAADELEHYDNIASPAREWLLDIVKKYQVEVLFSGHVHQFFYNTIENTTFYCLPPTSFIRQDYAELFRIGPANEYGRDDDGKFSVAMVDVLETGHRLRVIPTDGVMESDNLSGVNNSGLNADADCKQRLCVPLRHAWHESIDLPYNGPMEEFSRKRVRNDYTLLRLLQMNISDVRVPIQDLQEERVRLRMREYHQAGIRFHVFLLGQPGDVGIDAIKKHSGLVESVEWVSPTLEPALLQGSGLQKLISVLQQHDIELRISKAHSSAHTAVPGKPFAHSVSNGFLLDDSRALNERLGKSSQQEAVASIVFQVPWEDDLKMTLNQLHQIYADRPESIICNIRFANSNPATANFDDAAILERFSEACRVASTFDNLSLQFDTCMDIDRGYAPRHGFLDRRLNFRPLGRALL